jgi:hypothetical protein
MADGVRISMRLFGCSSGSSGSSGSSLGGSEDDEEATESNAESAEVGVGPGSCLKLVHHVFCCSVGLVHRWTVGADEWCTGVCCCRCSADPPVFGEVMRSCMSGICALVAGGRR